MAGFRPNLDGVGWHTAVHPSEKEDSSVFPMKLPKPHTWLPSPSSAPNISWQMGVSQKWSHSIHLRKTSAKSLFCSPFKRPHPPGGMPAVHATTRSLMGIPASANANVAWARLETRCTECELRGFSWCPCLAYDSHDNFGSWIFLRHRLTKPCHFSPRQCVAVSGSIWGAAFFSKCSRCFPCAFSRKMARDMSMCISTAQACAKCGSRSRDPSGARHFPKNSCVKCFLGSWRSPCEKILWRSRWNQMKSSKKSLRDLVQLLGRSFSRDPDEILSEVLAWSCTGPCEEI